MSPDGLIQSTWIFLFFRWIVPLNYDQTIAVRGRTARHISLRKMWLRRQRCHEWQRYIENIIRKYRTYLFPVKRWPDSSSLCSYMPHLSYLGIREAQLSLSYLPLWVYCSYRIKLDGLYPSRPCTWRQHNALKWCWTFSSHSEKKMVLCCYFFKAPHSHHNTWIYKSWGKALTDRNLTITESV